MKKKLVKIDQEMTQTKGGTSLTIRKKEWYEKYRWSITRNNYVVIAGRDVDQNESLVRKILQDNDIYMHADIQGAATTIIKDPKGITEEDLNDAAKIAASYSKAWKSGLGAVDVFWVYGSQVSKSPPTGEYLPKGSFMIYGKKNFIRNVKLDLAIGLEVSDNIRVIVGSEESIKEKSASYAVIAPGEEFERTADRLGRILSQAYELGTINQLRDEIIKILPGNSKILKVINNNKGRNEKQ
ncbi:NFACT RNA binding domain-containing protein [Acidianus sp. RZ1]|uniref:NFACT RNA binding domain-containing protein n=1 Tax=Acidianus sp. RZ1 TaxID=1540082 RepID=UPI001492C02C|nr:NFACT RNA binding domain-containing protein [Acidianus sp. RZ1]NON62288.1 DUF814 domain-containing protein [Acidianus sp. RZ1]